MKKIALAVLLSTLVAVPAVASDMYVGVRAGKATTSIDNTPLTDDSATGYGVFGGYSFSPMFAVEGEYLSMGEVKDSSISGVESSGFSLSGVGSFPIGEEFSLFGKLGYAKITSKGTGTNAGGTDAKSSGVTYGLGGQYNVNSSVGIRAGWDKYKLDDATIGIKGDVSLISVGGVFKF